MFTLGTELKDKVTGLAGIATARCEFLNGCVRYIVQQQGVDKDGKMWDEKWFDEGQLEFVGQGIAKEITPKKTGGPTSSTPPAGLSR